jgi:3-oxoacyl-[acyl-carrier protein] reductase
MEGKPLSGRVALVTGVSRRKGIGFAVARRFAIMGADIFVQSYTPYDAEQPWGSEPQGVGPLLEELRAERVKVGHIDANFADPDAARRVVEAAFAEMGNVDILVANHAYSTMGALEDLTAEQIDIHLAVNVRGSLLLIKEFAARHDDTRPGGRVIMMTSGQHVDPMPGELAYVASKGAIHQLTLSLSDHLIRRGITVNTVDPGATDTGWATPDVYEAVLRQNPQGRWGRPDDAARLIAWLSTDDAQWITGQVISSRGGG